MKTATLFLAAAGAALAQNLSGQPECATACLISAISAAGCAPNDAGCACGPTKTIIQASVAPCLIASCSPAALLQAQSAGEAQCKDYSATATATATETGKTSAASSVSTTAASTTSAATPTSGQTDAETTSAPTTGTSGTSGAEETSSPTEDATESDSEPEETSTSTGAAAAATAMSFGALLGVLGAVAAL